MYCMRLSALRKYTLAAWNGTAEVTVPETLASPDNSALPAGDCAIASRAKGNGWNATASIAIRNCTDARFMTGSFDVAVNSSYGSSGQRRRVSDLFSRYASAARSDLSASIGRRVSTSFICGCIERPSQAGNELLDQRVDLIRQLHGREMSRARQLHIP